jgi:thymidylate synthase (FAD)
VKRIGVLDHGYVDLVESWGMDERIIEAARMSTDKGFHGWGPRCGRCKHAFLDSDGVSCLTPGCQGGSSERVPGDEKLLRYLWEHKHATPFEMAGLVLEIQAPIFVFREWHRHRTQSYNELSARYTPLPDLNYVPTVERLLLNGGTNRQAGTITGAQVLDGATAASFIDRLGDSYDEAERLYQVALQGGVPKELARLCIPVGRYSRDPAIRQRGRLSRRRNLPAHVGSV